LTDTALWVGGNSSSPFPAPVNGYITDSRITKGADLYTASFSLPSVPLTTTVSSGTVGYLLNFQDSAIPDLSGLNNIDTVGNAKVAGSDPTKYGSNAMQFDGSGDYLETPFDDVYAFGTGDFTVEGWINFNSLGTGIYIGSLVSFGGAGSDNQSSWIFGYYANNGSPQLIFYRYDGTTETLYARSWTPNLNQWYHIASSRNGTDLRLFVDGVQLGATFTSSLDFSATTTQGLVVGFIRSGAGAATYSYLDGYVDDLRVTKGIARYTANFTPPSEALPKF
jgi:hypothetical protein